MKLRLQIQKIKYFNILTCQLFNKNKIYQSLVTLNKSISYFLI
jgi:hypothetical protein